MPSAVSGSAGSSLRSRQIAALKQLINLNEPVVASLAAEPVWKVLVFDRFGQDVISPLLSVKELRELGVTLHLLLESSREPLPDVPAVYFVLPTEANVRLVGGDLGAGLYESAYLNFISALSRPLLEELATLAVQQSCAARVQRLFDQHLDFISLDDDLFTLRRHSPDCPLSYYAINRPDMSQTQMDALIDSVVDGLFSVCVTLGAVPLIRCPRNNAAEQVAERLDKRIRENLRDARNNLFAPSVSARAGPLNLQRPLLVIVDRSIDLATMLHHTWTYQALVHDVLGVDLNRVQLREAAPDGLGRAKTKEYDLNVGDKFWMQQKGRPFPEVAEAVQKELEDYRSREDEIRRMKDAMGLDGETDEALSLMGDATARLTSTVSSLPDLLERKRLIDMHTNVATAVLEHIKKRKLDTYFETEEKLFNRQSPDTPVAELLAADDFGTDDDRLRLFLIHYICSDNLPERDLAQLLLSLEAAGVNDDAIKYVKQWKSFARLLSGGGGGGATDLGGGGTRTVSMFSRLLNQSSQLVMEGVKNMVIKRHNLPLTRAVDALMEQRAAADTDDYRSFDPKLLRPAAANATAAEGSSVRLCGREQPSCVVRQTRAAVFTDAIVFVVGGGNYVEYQNLADYARSKSSPRRITYGCTELVNASQFLAQLTQLGSAL